VYTNCIMVFPDDVPPPPDRSVTSPVVKTYVSQQHAFQIRAKKSLAATSTECKLCSEHFTSQAQYEAHIALENHTVKEAYRTNRQVKLSGIRPFVWCMNRWLACLMSQVISCEIR
jgi:hypothetical protein